MVNVGKREDALLDTLSERLQIIGAQQRRFRSGFQRLEYWRAQYPDFIAVLDDVELFFAIDPGPRPEDAIEEPPC